MLGKMYTSINESLRRLGLVTLTQQITLLPLPRHLNLNEGVARLSDKHFILLDCDHPQSLLFSAKRIKNVLHSQLNIDYEIVASKSIPAELIGLRLRLDAGERLHPQGYTLDIKPDGVSACAEDEAGLFYATSTLIQLIQYYGAIPDEEHSLPHATLPCLHIADWPDFLNRGYMLDISRDKVPTMETIYDLVDLIASWKINQLQLYTEHTFAYQNHPEVWKDASPFTGGEILALDAYCQERFIELVPNQNSFGHLEHWLSHPRYSTLAESPDGFDLPWGDHMGPYSLCPLDPGSITLISSLYGELLPHFSSRQFNVGCDETFDLGLGRSKAACEQFGTGQVYLDFLLKIYHEVSQRGFSMQFWSDIIMAHPELVPALPNDCIALEWGYEANHPFAEHAERYSQAGIQFYVCPGTSAWNSIAGRTENCLQNISSAATSGLKYSALGFLNTDWGDNGHWQVLPVSYLGIAAGTAYSWAYEANKSIDITSALNRFAFQDTSNRLGDIAYHLGNVYREIGIQLDNKSALFEFLQRPIHSWRGFPFEEPDQVFNRALELIDQISSNIPEASSRRPDHQLLQREFHLTVKLLRHACLRGLYGFGSSQISASYLYDDLNAIIIEYKDVWLLRNRPGGLKDSLAHFDIVLNDYK